MSTEQPSLRDTPRQYFKKCVDLMGLRCTKHKLSVMMVCPYSNGYKIMLQKELVDVVDDDANDENDGNGNNSANQLTFWSIPEIIPVNLAGPNGVHMNIKERVVKHFYQHFDADHHIKIWFLYFSRGAMPNGGRAEKFWTMNSVLETYVVVYFDEQPVLKEESRDGYDFVFDTWLNFCDGRNLLGGDEMLATLKSALDRVETMNDVDDDELV